MFLKELENVKNSWSNACQEVIYGEVAYREPWIRIGVQHPNDVHPAVRLKNQGEDLRVKITLWNGELSMSRAEPDIFQNSKFELWASFKTHYWH